MKFTYMLTAMLFTCNFTLQAPPCPLERHYRREFATLALSLAIGAGTGALIGTASGQLAGHAEMLLLEQCSPKPFDVISTFPTRPLVWVIDFFARNSAALTAAAIGIPLTVTTISRLHRLATGMHATELQNRSNASGLAPSLGGTAMGALTAAICAWPTSWLAYLYRIGACGR